MKKPFIWIAAIVVIIAAYLYASPYLALRSIKNAALEGNADVLSEHIDFPSVKQSLKDQINAQLMKEVAKEDADGFEALGAMMATAMIDPMVDSIVTPEGVAMMVQGKKPLQQDDAEDESAEAAKPIKTEPNPNIDYKTGYVSYKTFKVTLSNKDHDGDPIDIIMSRDGLGWKVTRINIPKFDKPANKPSPLTSEEVITQEESSLNEDSITDNEPEILEPNTVVTDEYVPELEERGDIISDEYAVGFEERGDIISDEYAVGFEERGDIISDEYAVGFEERGDIISDEYAADPY